MRDPSAASFGCLPGKGGFDKANKFSDNDARMYKEHSADKGIKKCNVKYNVIIQCVQR